MNIFDAPVGLLQGGPRSDFDAVKVRPQGGKIVKRQIRKHPVPDRDSAAVVND
jgi:hypothetical protein